LFGVIGITHGGGDGVATFNLPDYRGRFLRGVDGDAGVDPDSASRSAPQAANSAVTGGSGNTGDNVGSVEGDAFASHAHGVVDSGRAHSLTVSTVNVARINNYGSGTYPINFASSATQSAFTGISITSTGGAETRPTNIAVNYIIKL
jgi:microcystin-dependent protein